MIEDEYIKIDINLEPQLTDKFKKLTKQQIIERFCEVALEAYVIGLRLETEKETTKELQDQIDKIQHGAASNMTSIIGRLRTEKETLQTKLDKAEAYVEQGRAMIEAIMERWYEYDA